MNFTLTRQNKLRFIGAKFKSEASFKNYNLLINFLNPNYFLTPLKTAQKTILVIPTPNKNSLNSFCNRLLNETLIPTKTLTTSLSKTSWMFNRFKYSGKGLKIKKATKQQLVLFNLGASHVSKLYFNTSKCLIQRTKKNTYTFIYLTNNNTLYVPLFTRIKKFNKYTKRGVRLSRGPIIRRFGKVSQIAPKKR